MLFLNPILLKGFFIQKALTMVFNWLKISKIICWQKDKESNESEIKIKFLQIWSGLEISNRD